MPGRLSGARVITTPLGRSIAIGVMLYSRSTCDHGEHRAGIDFSVTPECTQDVPRPVLWVYFGSKLWGKYLILLVGAPRFELGTPSPPDWCANRAALRSAARDSYAARCAGARADAGRRRNAPRRRPRHRHQAPDHAEHQEIVAPVVAVDDDAFDHGADEGAVDRDDRSAARACARRRSESPASPWSSTSVR